MLLFCPFLPPTTHARASCRSTVAGTPSLQYTQHALSTYHLTAIHSSTHAQPTRNTLTHILQYTTPTHTHHAQSPPPNKKTRYWRQARTAGEIARDMRRNVSGMNGLVGLWGCDEGQGSSLTDWTDNHACCLGRGGTEWVHVPRGVPVGPVKGHGRWELLAAVGLRPDFESDDQKLPEEGEEGEEDGEMAGADDQVGFGEGRGHSLSCMSVVV